MTLYEKRGRRYYPVRETDAYDGLPRGNWLVSVTPGMKSIRRVVEPARAEVLAAANLARTAMERAMSDACRIQGRISGRKATDREVKAWAAYCDVLGGAPKAALFDGVSMIDVVDAGIAALMKEAP